MPNRFRIARGSVGAGLLMALLTSSAQAAESAPSLDNVVPLTVRTPHGGFNRMVVSVTVCAPGTERCATVDDVMVDTGSIGLRLEASAVPLFLNLPAFFGPNDAPLAECLHFVHDAAWGSLHRADLHIGGLTATDLPIQIISDDDGPHPVDCPVSKVHPTSNGTLGVGPWLLDCQGDCEQDERHPGVFVGSEGKWSPVRGAVARKYRLPNPAAAFPDHGNGVAFHLPMPPRDGAVQVVGTLTFGIDEFAIEPVDATRIVSLDHQGQFTTRFGGKDYPESYIDSGTETTLLPRGDIPPCEGMPWAFCADPERVLSATMVGQGGTSLDIKFRVGDYRAAIDRHVGAWDGFAEASGSPESFVWGAPTFLGRRTFVIFDGKVVQGIDGVIGPAYIIGEPGPF